MAFFCLLFTARQRYYQHSGGLEKRSNRFIVAPNTKENPQKAQIGFNSPEFSIFNSLIIYYQVLLFHFFCFVIHIGNNWVYH